MSTKARKQRKALYNAPLHKRQKMMGAHLTKELRAQLKRRSLPIRKGDEVKIMRGQFKGKTGKVDRVSVKHRQVFVDIAKRKRVSGEETHVPLQPSNILITSPNLDDRKRIKK